MKRIDCRHFICIAITIGFVALGVFKFFGAVGRLIESGRDIGLSAAYYFCELFQIPHSITPTVNDFPKIPFFDFGGDTETPVIPIPEDWRGFTEKWSLYWRTWATGENFLAYLGFLGNLLYVLSMAVLCLLPAVVLAYFLLKRFAKTENNDWGKDTKPLRIFKRIDSLLSCVATIDQFQQMVVKGLNTYAQSVEPQSSPLRKTFFGYIIRIGL